MEYEDRIAAFIDILGFAQLLNKTKIRNSQDEVIDNTEFISHLYRVFGRIRDLMGVDESLEGVAESRRVTQFSDSIVISFKLSDEPIEFKYMLGELLHLTTELLKSGILIRGGISYGSLIHTDKVLFGTAMVHAYMVESKAAIGPRIILPKSLYDKDSEFRLLLEYDDKTELELNNLLTRDEDDFYYLDYFDKCQRSELRIFAADEEYIKHLKMLRQLIVNGLKTNDPGIYSRYGWMKTKWNRTITKYKGSVAKKTLKNEGRESLIKYFELEKPIKTAM